MCATTHQSCDFMWRCCCEYASSVPINVNSTEVKRRERKKHARTDREIHTPDGVYINKPEKKRNKIKYWGCHIIIAALDVPLDIRICIFFLLFSRSLCDKCNHFIGLTKSKTKTKRLNEIKTSDMNVQQPMFAINIARGHQRRHALYGFYIGKRNTENW